MIHSVPIAAVAHKLLVEVNAVSGQLALPRVHGSAVWSGSWD